MLLHRALSSIKMQGNDRVNVITVSDVKDTATYLVANNLLGDNDIFLEQTCGAGPAVSRNIGLALANAPYVMFLDDDDSFAAGSLDALIPQIANSPDIYYCDFKVINEHRLIVGTQLIDSFDVTLGLITAEDISVKNIIPNNCLIYPRSMIGNRRFDDALILYEDWDFVLNVLDSNQVNLRYLPLKGLNIHKNDRTLGERRGARNDDKLVETILRIYQKWPGKTLNIKQMRQAYLAGGSGINLPIELF